MTIPFPLLPSEATQARLPFDVASVTVARDLVTADLREAGVARVVIEDTNLVVGELVMNGIRHGKPTEEGTVDIAWWLASAEVLRFSVCDGGNVDRLEARMPDPFTPGGRGLAIVDRLCKAWTYDSGNGTRITADIPLV